MDKTNKVEIHIEGSSRDAAEEYIGTIARRLPFMFEGSPKEFQKHLATLEKGKKKK